MRTFARLASVMDQVPADVVLALSAIDFGRGSEELHRHQLPGLLTELTHRARVESITASSAIEGIVVADSVRSRQAGPTTSFKSSSRDTEKRSRGGATTRCC